MLQRSNKVGEFPGHFVFPGGHPEVPILYFRITRFVFREIFFPIDRIMERA